MKDESQTNRGDLGWMVVLAIARLPDATRLVGYYSHALRCRGDKSGWTGMRNIVQPSVELAVWRSLTIQRSGWKPTSGGTVKSGDGFQLIVLGGCWLLHC